MASQTRSRSKKTATVAKTTSVAKKATSTRAAPVASTHVPGRAPPILDKGDPLPELRKICLALPEGSEKEAWSTPTFRVRDKLFAMFANNHHGDGRLAVWCKAPLGMQESLVESEPDRFFVPAYVGHQGWVGVRLEDDRVDWGVLASILREGYRMAAPRRLAALLDEQDQE